MIKLCQHFTHVVYNCPHSGFKDIQVVWKVPQFVCRLAETCPDLSCSCVQGSTLATDYECCYDLYCPLTCMFNSNSVPIPVLLAQSSLVPRPLVFVN